MSQLGTDDRPLRVAIIGAGPTGFYAADHLLKQKGHVVEVDLFDRLPTPYGLVRAGVAPDHQKIKSVTAAFDKVAAHPRFRFFGGVEFGRDLTAADLRRHYHQIVYTTGAQTDRRMGIPGEDLKGSHPATEFVAWYNGHPDYRDLRFDLSHERAAVVGVGNVAVDVARILCRSAEELAKTDIADYALEALRKSRIKEVYLLGRRGPAQAAFTNPEVKELGELADADVSVVPDEVELDPLSRAALRANPDRATAKKVEILQGYALRKPSGKSKHADHSLPRLARRADRQWRWRGDGDQARQEPARGGGLGRAVAQAHGRLRGAARGARVPLRGLQGRAAARRSLPRELGGDPERQGARPRSRDEAAGRGRVHRGLDQARAHGRDRHQQAGRARNGRVHDGRPGGGRGTSIPPSRMPRRPSA